MEQVPLYVDLASAAWTPLISRAAPSWYRAGRISSFLIPIIKTHCQGRALLSFSLVLLNVEFDIVSTGVAHVDIQGSGGLFA
jgi:hypothetical protein